MRNGRDVKLDNLRALIAHGDTTDKTNIKYILFRKILRSRAFYHFQRFIPASIRWAIAGFSSAASKEMTIENGDALVEKMLSFATDQVSERIMMPLSSDIATNLFCAIILLRKRRKLLLR